MRCADLPDEIGKVVDKLQVGEISEPFIAINKSNNRQQVAMVKLVRRIKAHKADLAEDFQVLKDMYENKRKAEIIDEWVKEKQKKTYVHISEGWRNAIKQMSQLCFLSIVIYIANTFLVQELIQIRAGIAAGILLFCIKPILERRWKKFILLVITAFFFHSSALAVLPLWFLKPNRLNVYFWGLLIPIGYVFAFLHINIFFFSVPLVQDKIDIYLSLQDTEDINLFNVLFIIKCFIGYLFLYYSSLLYFYNKYICCFRKIDPSGLYFSLSSKA